MHLDDPTIPRSIPGQVRGVQVNERFHGITKKKNHRTIYSLAHCV